MLKESAVIDLLAGQQRAWRAVFPGLSNRAHQTIVGYLCTRGRTGVAVRQIYGVTKELYLLDDATVRERVEEILRQGLCEATPSDPRLTGRTLVTPTEVLLSSFDTYLLAMCDEIRAAMGVIDPSLAGQGPTVIQDRDRATILQLLDSYALAWLSAAEQFLLGQNLSPARRTEARRRLTSTSYWVLMHRMIEHADQLRRDPATEPTLVADQLAAAVLDLTGQSFQTIRDHISWLISQGLLERAPGRVLRVSLAPSAGRYFDEAMRQIALEVAEASQRLGMTQLTRAMPWPEAGFAEDSPADQTIRMRFPGPNGGADPTILHWLDVVAPSSAAARVALGHVPMVIGRARPAQLLLPDGLVSRSHCQVEVVGEEVRVTDLGSTNGTFIDGRRIEAPESLPEGAMLRIGPYSLTYKREVAL